MREGHDPRGLRTCEGNHNEHEQEAEGRGKSGPIFAWYSLGTFAPGAACRLYSFVATYILGYDMYLTTRKMLTGENGEGSNAHTLPCGVRGVRQRLRMCWQ